SALIGLAVVDQDAHRGRNIHRPGGGERESRGCGSLLVLECARIDRHANRCWSNASRGRNRHTGRGAADRKSGVAAAWIEHGKLLAADATIAEIAAEDQIFN